MTELRVVGADDVGALGYRNAVASLAAALRAGLDPAAGPPRSSVPVPAGELLLMPAAFGSVAGVKIAAVVPGNSARGLARIQASYLLMDAATMQPIAVLDGNALTTLRTPAVSVLPVRERLAAAGPHNVVIFGAGPQGVGHLAALRAVCEVGSVAFVVRDPSRVRLDQRVLALTDPALARLLATAGVVVTATNARTPLFDAHSVRNDVTVLTVGSHEPTVRELPSPLLGAAQVVVEDIATAVREAGDVVLAIAEAQLGAGDLIAMADVVRGTRTLSAAAPVVVKTVGMAWQDLVVAAAVADRPTGQHA